MKTPRRIRTVVVSVPVDNDWLCQDRITQGSASVGPRFKPSDLVPWSDPYIAGLVKNLQSEVRRDFSANIENEAEMPWNEPFEYELDDTPGFSIDTDALLKR